MSADEAQDLFDLEDRVSSKASFLEFLKALEADFEDMARQEKEHPSQSEPAANGWFTATIGDFLESMRAWSVDNEIPDEPSWSLFAQMLHNGKLYE